MERLRLVRLVLGPLATNCYVLGDVETKEAVVIDPAPDDVLFEAVSDFRVTDILLTHAHFDHIGGVAELKRRTGALLGAHERERTGSPTAAKRLRPLAGDAHHRMAPDRPFPAAKC